MKLQVTEYLSIELTEPNELIELISEEDKIDFMQSLSCHDVVFEHVASQIIHGCTEGGYSGSQSAVSVKPSCPLDAAIREVSKLSGEVAKREIERLERAIKLKSELYDELLSKYNKLTDKSNRVYQ